MAGSFADHLEDEILDHILGNGSYTPPDIWVALSTAAYADTGITSEVSGGSYARVNYTTWDTSSGGASANTNAITFTTATASWGTVQSVYLMDASTSGNTLAGADLDAAKAVGTDDTFEIAAGDLDITLA